MTESNCKGLPDGPFGQDLADVSAALSSVYVELLHCTDFVLHKR